MSAQHEKENRKFKEKEGKRHEWEWCRIYPVDFVRAEDAYDIGALSKLELEVKTRLASASSPCDELVAREEEAEKEREADRLEGLRGLLLDFAAKAGLTERQNECFKLLCVERLSIPDAAEKMGVTNPRVYVLLQEIERKIIKSLRDQEFEKKAREILEASDSSLMPFDREILMLRYVEGRRVINIARRLGRARSWIYKRIKRLLA